MLLHIDAAVVSTSVVLLSGGDLMRARDGMEKVMGGLYERESCRGRRDIVSI